MGEMEYVIANVLEEQWMKKRTESSQISQPAEKKQASDSAVHSNSNRFVHGFVQFEGKVIIPGLGNFDIKAEYPRLKPKFERKHVEAHDLKALCSNLMVWVKDNFVTSGREQYFKELVQINILFVAYTYPLAELYSEQLDLCIKYCFWIWYTDDVIEDAIKAELNFAELKKATDQLQSILLGTYDNTEKRFESIANYPIFDELFDSLLGLHNVFRKRLPDYAIRVKNYCNDLQRYFGALTWFCANEIDNRYSEESFRTYRKALAHFDGIADLVALIHGVSLSDEMSKSLTMKRLLDVANSFGGFANDLLGIKKEFVNGQKDNLIVFMVLEEKLPLDVAVRRVCDFLANELADYILVKEVILREFNYDDNLTMYLHILDSLIDGYNVMHSLSERHLCTDSVTLTR